MSNQRRVFTSASSRFEAIRPATAGKPTTLVGYACVWNELSSDRGGYKVRLLPGSAKLADPIHALYAHDFANVLGSTRNGTLRLASDGYGLRVEIDLPDTTLGRDVAALVTRRDVEGMSFTMMGGPQRATEVVGGGQIIQSVEAFTLDEVTITAIPAFGSTSIHVAPPAGSTGYNSAGQRSLRLARAKLRSRRLLPL